MIRVNLSKFCLAILLCALLISIAATPGCSVGKDSASIYYSAITTARSEIWKDINSGKAGSATVAITENGKVEYSEGFGMADREKSLPVDQKTLFNIGSISKVYCASAIMLLVDEGKIALDSPVIEYLPGFRMADPRYKSITVRMLLNHTSGLPGGSYANNFGFEPNPDIYQNMLDNLARSSLKHDPGAMAVYCNEGFTLAEMVVAEVSGQKYNDYLSEKIFKPLALNNTGLSVGEQSGKPVAYYYRSDSAKPQPPEVLSVVGAGGLAANTEDLCRFADMFSGKGKQIFGQSSLDEMKKAQPSAFAGKLQAGEMSFGLGWDMTSIAQYQAKGIQVIGKSGGTGNYVSMVLTVPAHRISIAVIETGPGGSAVEIASDMLADLLAVKGLIEKDRNSAGNPLEKESLPASLTAYAGDYSNGNEQFKVYINSTENTVNVNRLSNGIQNIVLSLFYHDGYLYDQELNRYYFTSVDSQDYLVAFSKEFSSDNILVERLAKLENPLSLRIQVNGQSWLRRNIKPYEGFLLDSSNIIKSSDIDNLTGYVDFGGLKKVTSPDSAGMVSKSKRDQSELTLFDKDGQTWAWVSDLLYSPAGLAGTLTTGQSSVQISNTGNNEWLKTGTGLILNFEIPTKGRVFVSSEDSAKLWDSALDSGDVFVPPDSFVQFAGQAGDTFKISAKDITDSEKQALIDRTIRYQTEGNIYHADSYTVVKLKKGDIIYGMLPGQSVFYTDQATLDSANGSYKTMYQLLQIRPHPVYGYRTKAGKYEVQEDFYATAGLCQANREITIDGKIEVLGEGGAYQYVVFNYTQKLKLVEEINLHE